MDRKKIIAIASAAIVILCGCIGYLIYSLQQRNAENEEML